MMKKGLKQLSEQICKKYASWSEWKQKPIVNYSLMFFRAVLQPHVLA